MEDEVSDNSICDVEIQKKVDNSILYSTVKAYLLKEIEKVYDWYKENKEK